MTAVYVAPAGLAPELTEFAAPCLRAQLDRYSGVPAAMAVVRDDSVVHGIDAEARRRGCDLLVVGAHGRHWMSGSFLGSTAETLVRVAQIPVLLVKNPPRGPYRRVVLAVDTSPIAAQAVRTGDSLTPHAAHIVLHVSVVVGETLLRIHGANEEQLAELRKVSIEQARVIIERLASEVGAPAVIESGRPQTRLPELLRRHHADLVAVGTGGHSALGYALLGSVAQHVMRDTLTDVLVVPAARRA